jgi:hypothetical protein
MNRDGQSDRSVVPANPPNKAAAAEAGEERERAKGNTGGETRPGRSAGSGVSSELGRVRQVAVRDKEARFTALLHHVTLERLLLAYQDISPKAAPGVDGVTWEAYGQDLVANLRDLHERVQQGRYRASPGRRAYILKADGRLRPLGIATLEDKIVQRAVVEVLNAVYEADFLGFSYGFRPGRNPHQALDALVAGIYRRKVNWRFWVKRITISKRMRAKLKQVKVQLTQRRHLPVPEQGRWLASVLRGHMAYYAVPGNIQAIAAFRDQLRRHWRRTLRRRSQKTRINWQRTSRIANRWLPPARVMHPFPEQRFAATHPRQEPSAVIPHAGICAGAAREGGPTATQSGGCACCGAGSGARGALAPRERSVPTRPRSGRLAGWSSKPR